MTPAQYQRAQEIMELLDSRPSESTDTLISDYSEGDATIEQAVRKMLDMRERQTFADVMSDDVIEAARRQREELLRSSKGRSPGNFSIETIGPYRVVREIGRGGMGIVYECEQTSPRRRVAVKVVDSLRNVATLEARLKAEAQIQGRLQHPGIAQIYDAGIAQIGTTTRPYIVMELIDGTPMQAYAGDPKRSVRDQLELIAHIADAMASAHSRGVIHRDLKPDNVLVLPEGQPKILDFGIARLVDDVTIAMTTMTQDGQILGTLAYMAPEQLSGKSANVGPPADVYALGAMAYELIAGHPPLQLADMSLSAAFRAIELEEPIGIRRLNKSIEADVETIIGKCLCREPERRYANAGELADDIRRFLCNRPILARAPTRRYRATKFVRRNRLLVAGVAATTLSLAAGLIGMSFFASGQHRARLVAQQEETRARQKELDAIRGVLAGAAALSETGSLWEAAKQLHSIDPDSRGWEWDHTALMLPWLVEMPSIRRELDPQTKVDTRRFVNDTQIFRYTRETGEGELLNVFTGDVTPLDTGGRRISHELIPIRQVSGKIGLIFDDGDMGLLSIDSGVFEPIDFQEQLPPSRTCVSPDGRIVVAWGRGAVAVYDDGKAVFTDDMIQPPDSPYWGHPVFDPNGQWLCLLPNSGEEGPICLDTKTWEVISRGPSSNYILNAVVSNDGNHLYLASYDSGIRVFAMPGFEPVTEIHPELGFTRQVVISPDGDLLLFSAYDLKQLIFYSLGTNQIIRRMPIGAPSFHDMPVFSPDGSLIAAHSPDNVHTWIIDRDHLELPRVTHLSGHESWIYQLAVSPDGSLLASAAPQGDIILWDLMINEVVARIRRQTDKGDGATAFYMNAPLLFADDGDTLVFAELNDEQNAKGLGELNLRTGERSWTRADSLEQMLDVAAGERGNSPGNLYHHAAVLPNKRILQSQASSLYEQKLMTRAIGAPASEASVLGVTRAEVTTGVALHPSNDVYAAGEYLMIRIRDARTDEVLFEIDEASSGGTYNLAYSPDGSRLVIGTKDGRVLLFETEFYKKVAEFEVEGMPEGADRNYVYNVAWTPDGKRLVTCAQNSIRILESEHPRLRLTKRAEWEQELNEARRGEGTPAAERMIDIERWVSSRIAQKNAAPPGLE